MNRANAPAFKKKHKISEYGLQLIEKQKIKAYYGILERQLRRYYALALKKEGKTGEELIRMLETRLDNIVYRAGFASSIRMARQMVTHRHFTVNGKKINIPSFEVPVGSEICLVEKDRKNPQFKKCFLELNKAPLEYIQRNEESFSAKLVSYPERKKIPVEINDQLVVEFYSK